MHGVNRTNNNQLPRAGRVNPAAFTMENFEDIKEGGIYDVRIVVEQKRDHALLACALSDVGETNKPRFVFYERTVSDFRQATPENGTKNTEPAPKYDPCRLFRKGDKVRMVEWHGRSFFDGGCHPNCNKWTVTEDETSGVNVEQDGCQISEVPPCYLELVTPVEEIEPYFVSDDDYEYCVFDRRTKMTVCRFDMSHPHPKEAAEAERDRLNAEYRKEMGK